MLIFPVWARLLLLAVFITAAASSWTGFGPLTHNWIPFSSWTLGLSCFWFWFRQHSHVALLGLPLTRWSWLAPLAWVFLSPHLLLRDVAYSVDISVLLALVLGILVWIAGLFTLSLGALGRGVRFGACALPVAILILFFLYGENLLDGKISRVLVAGFLLMAWGTGFLLLLDKNSSSPMRNLLCEPINLMTNLGFGGVVLAWVWLEDDRELNTRVLLLSFWVLIVQGLSRWLAHREKASLRQMPYSLVSRIYRRLGWLAAATIWLISDTEAVMMFVLLPLLLLFALLAVMAAPEPLRSLRTAIVGLSLTTVLVFYWQGIPLFATLRLPSLFLLVSTILTLVLLIQANRPAFKQTAHGQ